MKKRIFISIAMLLAVVCVWAGNNQQRRSTQTIYYVVIGSFNSLQEAQDFNNNAPYDTVFGSIYTAKVNGRTVYRVCTDCFYSKQKAQTEVNNYKKWMNEAGRYGAQAWIWSNRGLARCVERGMGNDGNYFSITPR